MALLHCKRLIAKKGEARAMTEMRKHLAWYLKGMPGTARLKGQLFRCKTYIEAENLMISYLHSRIGGISK